MTQGTSILQAEELFGYYADLLEPRDNQDERELYWQWPEEIGKGTMSLLHLRPGMYLEIGNYLLRKDIAIGFQQSHHSLSLAYSFSGSMQLTVNADREQQEHWGFREGHSIMGYMAKGQHNILRASADRRICTLCISIDPRIIPAFVDDQKNQIPPPLKNIIHGSSEAPFYQEAIISPTVHLAIQQILHCPYRSSLKKLFLEGKVLELLAHSLARFSASGEAPPLPTESCPVNAERILEARNILISNLETPPSLAELARKVGMNRTTLNKGFRQIFGTSVFDYLRIYRLEQARELLYDRKLNVTEAAFRVGYAQQSSFTKAFKKHFGNPPQDLLHCD